MNLDSRIYLAGHRGLVGSSILRRLKAEGYQNIITRKSDELDLRDQKSVSTFFADEKPEYIILAAARVGGILANSSYPAEFIYDNLMIQTNVIHQSYLHKAKKLLFLGSTCIYPKNSPNPLKEEYLLTGKLEPTNEFYAVAKIVGIKMCQAYNRQYHTNYISVMPTNLYGPGDNFDLETSHVIPALIRKFHEGKESNKKYVEVWGTGTPRREFIYIEDLAEACIFLMLHYDDSEIINIGVGRGLSILQLAEMIKGIIGYQGEIKFDRSKPDGTRSKLLDISKIKALGWEAKYDIKAGIEKTYEWYKKNCINN
jgi:GDP-L-fucose synthase